MDDAASDPLRVVHVLRLHDRWSGHLAVQRHLDAVQVSVLDPGAQEPDQEPLEVLRADHLGLRRVSSSGFLPDEEHQRSTGVDFFGVGGEGWGWVGVEVGVGVGVGVGISSREVFFGLAVTPRTLYYKTLFLCNLRRNSMNKFCA